MRQGSWPPFSSRHPPHIIYHNTLYTSHRLISLFRYTEDDSAEKPTSVVPEVKSEATAPIDVKADEPTEQGEQNGDAAQQIYSGEQDMDDDIDFNLGNDNGYETPATHEAHGPGIKEDG